MTLVDDQQIILRKKIEQTVGALTFLPTVEVAGVVLYSTAMPQFLDHLHVVFHPFLNALCLNGITHLVEEINLLDKIILDSPDGMLGLLLGSDEQIGGIDLVFIKRSEAVIGNSIEFLNGINLIIPPGDTQDMIAVGHEYIHRISFHTEIAPFQFNVVAHIQSINQLTEEAVTVECLSFLYGNHAVGHSHRTAHTIDTRYRRYHHHIFPAGE